MERREFLKKIGSGVTALAIDSSHLLPSNKPETLGKIEELLNSDYPFPYDSDCFEASERIVFLDSNKASLNIIPKEGKSLDIKLYHSVEDKMRICGSRIFYSVNDTLEIPIRKIFDPELYYRIEYKESGNGSWKSTPKRTVKTPNVKLNDRKIEVILIGDDHTPDDADLGKRVLNNPNLIKQRLSGEYVNLFLKKLIKNPKYVPREGSELAKLMNGFCLASTIRQIMANENPDFIVNLGDHRGGFQYKWEGLGLKKRIEVTPEEREQYLKIFRVGTRKMLSALTPQIPIYWALGNHDAESGHESTKEPATKYRKKFFKLPGTSVGGSPDENYYPIRWGAYEEDFLIQPASLRKRHLGALFIVLDNQRYNPMYPKYPNEWTLGEEQKEWFKEILKYEADYKFVLFHHVLGGWPAGSDESIKDRAYGRGPLFNHKDYAEFYNNPNLVEQVGLTELMKQNGVDVNFYGHDHIFNAKKIGGEYNGKNMYGVCVGSTKNKGELKWYKGDFWEKYYGDYGEYYGLAQKADFWGPSGYTKLTIDKNGLTIEYIRSANNHPLTNIPSEFKTGDCISRIMI